MKSSDVLALALEIAQSHQRVASFLLKRSEVLEFVALRENFHAKPQLWRLQETQTPNP
jgi:hypothetical protein